MSTDHHRGRNVNWTQAEKDLLLRLIERHTDTIENKRSDYASLVQRAESWAEISKDFSVAFPFGRHLKRLREQYQRMKCSARKEFAKFADASEKGVPCLEVSLLARRIARLAPADFMEFVSGSEDPGCVPFKTDAFFVSKTDSSSFLPRVKSRREDDVPTAGGESKPSEYESSRKIQNEMPLPLVYIENVSNDLAGNHGSSEYRGRDDAWNIKKEPATSLTEYADQETLTPQVLPSKAVSQRANKRPTISPPANDATSMTKQRRLPSSGPPALTAVEKNQIALQKLEHEVKVQHMETEHRLKLDIMRLQKRLLEKQLETLDKVSATEIGSRAEVISRSLLDSNSFGLRETYELD